MQNAVKSFKFTTSIFHFSVFQAFVRRAPCSLPRAPSRAAPAAASGRPGRGGAGRGAGHHRGGHAHARRGTRCRGLHEGGVWGVDHERCVKIKLNEIF